MCVYKKGAGPRRLRSQILADWEKKKKDSTQSIDFPPVVSLYSIKALHISTLSPPNREI
jgi:hypothetical protein